MEMNRLKCKIWDKKNKRMGVPSHIEWQGIPDESGDMIPGEITNCIFKYLNDNGEFDSYCINKNDAELLLCTSNKDKNNVEVYEGDILKFYSDFFSSEICVVVEFDSIGFSYIDIKRCIDTTYAFVISNAKIIGNKFKNPELLEKEKCK